MSRSRHSDKSDSSDSSTEAALNDESKWEDVEPDLEEVEYVSLFDDKKFADLKSMFLYCKERFNFDFVAVQNQLGLDFYGRIKLVNYIRMEAKKGHFEPDVSSFTKFDDDQYLQPVLENDALLFSLDELDNPSGGIEENESLREDIPAPSEKIKQLEEKLEDVTEQFASYRQIVQRTLGERWTDPDPPIRSDEKANSNTTESREDGYFEAYSYNDIHETMLKDTVRTNAYRDFVYDNKHLFQGKVVLDVGCGTGILSMFCARAGAAKVIAVDNSKIIEKANRIIKANSLQDTITCIGGKIEEVALPVDKVDIIISEWMGYCLLYEAMLNSVIWARDKYLKPDGLMVPSHCVLHLSPFTDPEYVSESVEFWYDVYGFDMTAMMDKIYDDVLIRSVKPECLAGESCPFLVLQLSSIKVTDLQFRKPFSVAMSNNIENLDGWALWFDTFFLPSSTLALPSDVRAENWRNSNKSGCAFTTGPKGIDTHWHCGVLLIDRNKHPHQALPKGAKVSGSISYSEVGTDKRGLEIEITWNLEESGRYGQQLWYVR